MRPKIRKPICIFLFAYAFSCWPSSTNAVIDVNMVLNEHGFVSYDHFQAMLYLNNHGAVVPNASIFGVLEISGEFYFWPSFNTSVDFATMGIAEGEFQLNFLEFNFPNIDAIIPFGPMNFWGAWYVDNGHYGYDVQEFWLGGAYKWTPTPVPGTATNTPAPTKTPTPAPPTPIEVVYISPGEFTMGSPSDEACSDPDEGQHKVTLTRAYYMMRTEVTRQMWADLKQFQPELPSDPSDTPQSPTMNHPVQKASWCESILFANLLSVKYSFTRCYYKDEGFATPVDETNYSSGTIYCDFSANGFRLPTESEWEYACRSGTTGSFSCTEPNYDYLTCGTCTLGILPTLEQYCVFCACSSGLTAVAGSKLPNPWGLYDMHGNVLELCWDWYDTYPTESVTDPIGPSSGSSKTLRGGFWIDNPLYCRSASRDYTSAYSPVPYQGFRLVRNAP